MLLAGHYQRFLAFDAFEGVARDRCNIELSIRMMPIRMILNHWLRDNIVHHDDVEARIWLIPGRVEAVVGRSLVNLRNTRRPWLKRVVAGVGTADVLHADAQQRPADTSVTIEPSACERSCPAPSPSSCNVCGTSLRGYNLLHDEPPAGDLPTWAVRPCLHTAETARAMLVVDVLLRRRAHAKSQLLASEELLTMQIGKLDCRGRE